MEIVGRNIKNLIKKSTKRIVSPLYIDYNSDYKASIFLAGVGRSGTTWVSDIINYKTEYRYIFEPFHPYAVEACRKFRYRQYLRPENQDTNFIKPAGAILSGRIKNNWTDRYNKKFISNKRLIKDIRANLLLKWMCKNFPGIQIILLLRHPCAVAHSKLKLNWNNHLEEFLAQKELMEDYLNPFRKEIEKAQTDFEKHIFQWCIENYIPLKQFKQSEIHLAFYENFCLKPEEEIKKLFSFLGKNFDETVFMRLEKPSSLSRKESAIISGEDLINSWRKHITDEQIKRAVEILSLFGLDTIYSQDSMPDINNAYNIMITYSKAK